MRWRNLRSLPRLVVEKRSAKEVWIMKEVKLGKGIKFERIRRITGKPTK